MSYLMFFDSGLGGLSVLREAISLHPEENYLFIADGKNLPYGDKSPALINSLVCETVANAMREYTLRAVVIACNTATSAAIATLRDIYKDIPVIGIEPAVKPACARHPYGKIGVMATSSTLAGEKFKKLCESCSEGSEITPLPCPGLVELIESRNAKKTIEYLNRLFNDRPDFDCIVLGCTHYPFIKDEIITASHCPDVIDGAGATVQELFRRLGDKRENDGKRIFINTDGNRSFADKAEAFLNPNKISVNKII